MASSRPETYPEDDPHSDQTLGINPGARTRERRTIKHPTGPRGHLQERGLPTTGRGQKGQDIKNKEEILQLLEAVWELSQVAVTHCGGQEGTQTLSSEEIAWLIRQQGRWQKDRVLPSPCQGARTGQATKL